MKNKTTFLRSKKSENYTVISNSIIKSTDYTSQEKDILLYLLHLPDDWVIYKENIKKHYKNSISSKKFDDSWQRLKTKGHIQGSKIKLQNGKFSSWEYKIIEKPTTDIPDSDMSGNGVVENTSIQNHRDILSTNLESTNEQNTNSTNNNNTINILEEKYISNSKHNIQKNWNQKEIQLDMNKSAFNSIFENSGIDWEYELSSKNSEDFIKKYFQLDKKSTDDNRLRFLVETYFKLNSQPQKGIHPK